MSNARGNNKAGSSKEYEQERLENIKRIKKIWGSKICLRKA
jgi:hypothetical protein